MLYSAYEISEMMGITYSAVQGRLNIVNAKPVKQSRIVDKYSSEELDKLKVPKHKRFTTESFIIYESKMNEL